MMAVVLGAPSPALPEGRVDTRPLPPSNLEGESSYSTDKGYYQHKFTDR